MFYKKKFFVINTNVKNRYNNGQPIVAVTIWVSVYIPYNSGKRKPSTTTIKIQLICHPGGK